ncbi:MAG: hypothetical protein CMI67_22650 [Pelagibaca sp.]|nr:hypothetical protein [Pelagibaca sp.]
MSTDSTVSELNENKSRKKSRRRALIPGPELVQRHAEIQSLRIDDMVLKVRGRAKMYFKRLRYKGCPVLSNITADFKPGTELIDANRDSFIRYFYQLMATYTTQTVHSHFHQVITYLRWIDSMKEPITVERYLDVDVMTEFVKWSKEQALLGAISSANAADNKRLISMLFKQTNRMGEVRKLPEIKGVKAATKGAQALDIEGELKPTVRALFRGYRGLLSFANKGELPERHPIYDKTLVDKEAARRKLRGNKLAGHRGAFKKCFDRMHPNNPIVQLAILITYMFTGMNTKPLADLRIRDVTFRKIGSGNYIFDSEKGRAMHQKQDNSLGFSKYAMEFIESWMLVAKEMANGDTEAYLFPHYYADGTAGSYAETGKTPQTSTNKMLAKMGLSHINPSIFRKTKSDTVFRVTESVYLVSMMNNNSPSITRRTYINGTQKEHENNLGAAMDAAHAIAKGSTVKDAVETAKFNHGDILDDYEFQRLRKGKDRTNESRTPHGGRCLNNRAGAAQVINKLLNKAGIETNENEVVCTDFLACFWCKEHKLVAEVDDIWLMLSFKETLQQLQQTPSVNSIPSKKYTELFEIVESILKGYNEKSPSNCRQAHEKIKQSAHPLYDDVYSLNDLLDVFS